MVEHNTHSAGCIDGLGKDTSQTTANGDIIHMGCEDLQVLDIFCHTTDIRVGCCENYTHIVFFSSLIGNAGQIQDLIAEHIVFRANLKEGWFQNYVSHNKVSH